MGSENPSGADNQQERPGSEEWIVGFVDGEGCFSISVVRNAHVCARLASPARVRRDASVAIAVRPRVRPGRARMRTDRGADQIRQPSGFVAPLLREAARRPDGVVVPFFTERPLRTAKRLDFERFATVLQMMEDRRHRTKEGLALIASITETMNRQQRSRYLESSEAIRQPSRSDSEMKIWS